MKTFISICVAMVIVLLAHGGSHKTMGPAISAQSAGNSSKYISSIRVLPDTLSFVWSQGEGLHILASDAVGKYVTDRELVRQIDRSLQGGEVVPCPVLPEGEKGVDTLSPPWEGPFYIGWVAEYRIEYEATQLVPSQPANVIAIMHGVASDIDDASKQCSVFVWDSRSGSPGGKLYGASVTASAPVAYNVYLNWYSTPSIQVTGPFWVGNYEIDTLYPTSALDSVITYPNKYSEDGSTWEDDEAEYFHAAVVSYDAIFDTAGTMMVYNDGDTELVVSNVAGHQPWIVSIDPVSFTVQPGEFQVVSVQVSRNGLTGGTYYGSIIIDSNDPDDPTYQEPVRFVIHTVGVAEEVTERRSHPLRLQCSPNPFTGETTIMYELPQGMHVALNLYDSCGRKVRTLVESEMEAGLHSFHWDGRDEGGAHLPSAVYFCRIEAGSMVSCRKIVVLDR